MTDETDWTYFGQPVPVVAIHQTSRAALHGHATAWNKKGHVIFVSFPCTDSYAFSDLTGMGRGLARAWRLSHPSLCALTGDPERVMKEPRRRRASRPSAPKPEDPRQMKIEWT